MLLLRSLSFSLNKFYASRKCFHYCFWIGLISPKLKWKVTPFEMNTEHGKKTELGTKKTPKGGHQSKRKEILFLLIDSYSQLININVCEIKMRRFLDNQNASFVRIKQQHNHGNNNNNKYNSLRDRRNSTAPDGLVGSPKWRMVRTNLTRFRSFSVLCG